MTVTAPPIAARSDFYRCIDCNCSPHPSSLQNEMTLLMYKLDSAAFKIGITPRPATDSELKQLTEEMFKEADMVRRLHPTSLARSSW